jgi:release factor glutamine methyltransferase
MTETWTIRSLLAWMGRDFQAAGIATARLDAEVLLAHALRVARVQLYLDFDRPLAKDELSAVRALVVRRRKREPVAYIVGQREFYKRVFCVGPAVLVPRPETETLVERALEVLAADQPARMLDLCTGSGAIAITLAAERAQLVVDATDLSPEALDIARENARLLAVQERVSFAGGDLFAALPQPPSRVYSLLSVNPPYVSVLDEPTLAPEIREFEPALALYAGADGLAVIRRICDEAPAWLASGARLLMEVGAGQAEPVLALLAADTRWDAPRALRDLAGVARVIEAVCV